MKPKRLVVAVVSAPLLSSISVRAADNPANGLACYKEVNDLMRKSFIPIIENDEVKSLIEAGLKI